MFLAPEVCRGIKHDGRLADVYALGVCLFMFIYGIPPFKVSGARTCPVHVVCMPPCRTTSQT